ncbi:MAG: hypothetical protein JJ992_12700 [Planctomycetes bacterium]|nr:hypothetical protein [Planctomycetota bacterium]
MSVRLWYVVVDAGRRTDHDEIAVDDVAQRRGALAELIVCIRLVVAADVVDAGHGEIAPVVVGRELRGQIALLAGDAQ